MRTLLLLPLAVCLFGGGLLAVVLPLGRAVEGAPRRAADALAPWEAQLARAVAGELADARSLLERARDWTHTGALDLRAPHAAHALLHPLVAPWGVDASFTLHQAAEGVYTIRADGGGALLRLNHDRPFGPRTTRWDAGGASAGESPHANPAAAADAALADAGLASGNPWALSSDGRTVRLAARRHFKGPDGADCAAALDWATPAAALLDTRALSHGAVMFLGDDRGLVASLGAAEGLGAAAHGLAMEHRQAGKAFPLTALKNEYWMAGRWLDLPEGPAIWVAVAMPDRVLMRWDLQQLVAAAPGLLLAILGALMVVGLFTRRWMRLTRIVAAKADAVEREGVAPAYWPRTRVREFRQVQTALDRLARAARRPPAAPSGAEDPRPAEAAGDTIAAPPAPRAEAQELAPPPQAYVQALQSTRRQLRDLQAEVEELYLELQEAGARDQALRERLERQRAVLVEAGADHALLEGGAREALEAIAASAAKALGLARVALWRYAPGGGRLEGILRYERLARRAEAAPDLDRTALPVLFLALESDPVIASRDLAGDSRLRELAARLPGAPPTGAVVAVALRRAGAPVALCLFEHAGGERHWEADEINFLAGMAYLCLPRLAPVALPAPAGVADLALPRPDAPAAEDGPHRQLVEQTTGMMWLMDHEGRFQYVNPAAAAAYGWPANQMAGRYVSEFTAAGFAQLERLALRAVRDGQPRYSYLTEHLRANGESFTLAVNLSPARDAAGNLAGFVALAADTTDARQPAGRAKSDPETHFRALVEGSPELIFELDSIGCIRSVNAAAGRVYGYEPAELIGQPISMLTDGAQARKDLDRLTAILDGRDCAAYETSHIRKDARRVRLLVVAEPQRDAGDRVVGIIGAAIELAPEEVERLAAGGDPAAV